MFTRRLFEENVYKKECQSKVISLSPKGLVLDETIFFPTGGGQSCDKGNIDGIPVDDVFMENNIIYHVADGNFSVGDTVSCTLDWEHRFENMQRHCGEHILSGIFHREYGGINKGFHMGSDYMTIDIALEDDKKLTLDMALHAESCANDAIWANLPVSTRKFKSKEDLNNIPLRKALTIEEEITVVCIGDENNPSDCVFCCGTHPSHSGQVGLVKIYKLEKYKDMYRIYFDAGKKALADYKTKHSLLSALCSKYSSTPSDLLNQIALQEEKTLSLKKDFDSLKSALIKERSLTILNNIANCNFYEYNDLSSKDALSIGKAVYNEIDSILLLYIKKEKTILLFSNGKINCQEVVSEIGKEYKGKGGGNSTSARISFPNNDMCQKFIDYVSLNITV